MLFAMIFVLCFFVLAIFVFWLSRNIAHGEARFDTTKEKIDGKPAKREQIK